MLYWVLVCGSFNADKALVDPGSRSSEECMSVSAATLSVVLPICGDAANLVAVIRECLLVLPTYFDDYEIIIVDDGSPHSVSEQADHLAASYAPVMVIHHRRPRGYGLALISGLQVARGDYLLCMDTFSPVNMEDVARVMPFVTTHDLIVAYRLQQPGMGSALYTRMLNWLFALDLRDIGARFMLIQAHLVQPAKLNARGALIYAEMVVQASQHSAQRVQVGISPYVRAGDGHTDNLARINVWSFWELVALRLRLGKAPPPMTSVQRPVWQQRTTFGAGLVAVAGGIWFLLRRRG